MQYVGDRVEKIKIAYIGGGSKGWAWGLMSDLAREEQLSGCVYLYDIDYDAAYSNEIIGNKVSLAKGAKSGWKYKAVDTIGEALKDSDFVIISILPGTFDEMESDVHSPEKYGVYQSVGDTVGPGGFMRALRTIPMFEYIAQAIKQYSPDAWVINYTNPMTLCVRTLYEVFPEIKAFGCCHEVFGTQHLLSQMLEDIHGIKDVHREDIKINVLGINHFTWINKASYKGMDLIPSYKLFADKYYENGFDRDNKEEWKENYFASAQRVKFDLFKRYGVIAAAGDRHLAEFMPPWYLKNPETVRSWKFSLTPVSWRKEQRKALIEKSNRIVSGEEDFQIKVTGEEGVKQIKAILGLSDLITNVNLPNTGQIEGLPKGAVVETNAYFTRDRIQPIISGKLPKGVDSLILRHVLNQENILTSAMKRDKNLAFATFINDPNIQLHIDDSKKLFIEMLDNTKEYLQGWDMNRI